MAKRRLDTSVQNSVAITTGHESCPRLQVIGVNPEALLGSCTDSSQLPQPMVSVKVGALPNGPFDWLLGLRLTPKSAVNSCKRLHDVTDCPTIRWWSDGCFVWSSFALASSSAPRANVFGS